MDPDPAYNFDTDPDPDPTYNFDADPDPIFQLDADPWGSGSVTLLSTKISTEEKAIQNLQESTYRLL